MRRHLLWLILLVTALSACRRTSDALTFSGSVLGPEGAIVSRQIERFADRKSVV